MGKAAIPLAAQAIHGIGAQPQMAPPQAMGQAAGVAGMPGISNAPGAANLLAQTPAPVPTAQNTGTPGQPLHPSIMQGLQGFIQSHFAPGGGGLLGPVQQQGLTLPQRLTSFGLGLLARNHGMR